MIFTGVGFGSGTETSVLVCRLLLNIPHAQGFHRKLCMKFLVRFVFRKKWKGTSKLKTKTRLKINYQAIMINIEHRHFALVCRYGVLWWLVTCNGGMGGPGGGGDGRIKMRGSE